MRPLTYETISPASRAVRCSRGSTTARSRSARTGRPCVPNWPIRLPCSGWSCGLPASVLRSSTRTARHRQPGAEVTAVSCWSHSSADCEVQPRCHHTHARSLSPGQAGSNRRAGLPVQAALSRKGAATAAGADTHERAPLDLSHRVCARGDVVVNLGGELDIVTAEAVVSYVRGVIDRCGRPVVVNLTALASWMRAAGAPCCEWPVTRSGRAASSGWPRRGRRRSGSCGSPA